MSILNKFKKQFTFLLLFVTAVVNIGNIGAHATPINTLNAASTAVSDHVTIVAGGNNVLGPHFRGDQPGAVQHRLNYQITVVKDVQGTAAYCITPFARGVQPNNEPQTLMPVPNERLDEKDKQLLGIMIAGYPNTSYGRSANDEYMATLIAIQHFVFQNPEKYPNPRNVKFNDDSWSKWENLTIIELAKTIYNKGITNPYDPNTTQLLLMLQLSPKTTADF